MSRQWKYKEDQVNGWVTFDLSDGEGNNIGGFIAKKENRKELKKKVELIAAAPQLLEVAKESMETLEAVCEECEEGCDGVVFCSVKDTVNKLEKEIQKAEGDLDETD